MYINSGEGKLYRQGGPEQGFPGTGEGRLSGAQGSFREAKSSRVTP